MLEKFMEDAAQFLQATKPAPPSFLADARQGIVFEGAQGLLLDQERGWFPHVTRSHTGIRNVLDLAAEAGIEALDVAYVTRAYVTRHGAGPLPHALDRAPYAGIRDETNVPNAYQGTLRFAWLEAELLATAIARDLSDHKAPLRLRHGLAVTCLDQVEGRVSFVNDNSLREMEKDAFLNALKQRTGAAFMLASAGASRREVAGF